MPTAAPGRSSPPSTPQSPPSPQRQALAALTRDLPLKAMAVFLAIVLWFVVNAKEPQLELVPVRFTPILDSALVLREAPPTLQAIVAGSPKELIKLNSNPPIVRRQITADSPDTVVLDLRPDDVTLPEGVDAVVRDVQPRSVTLRFETTWSRKVPVRSEIQIGADQVAGPIETDLDPDTVLVTGPRNLILRIPWVRTVKTVIGFPDSLPHLVDLDTTGFAPGVRVRPSQIKVYFRPLPHA